MRVSGKSEKELPLQQSQNSAGFGFESDSFGSGFEEEKIFTKDASQQQSNGSREQLLKSEAFGS